ncbi:UNVERIFIED_CONTAM: hypothetical protein PYX00_008361 [Menopon gallinae]|uniref:Trans-1,2-dihydrobenzene-1,2-diol dehydrogenase n=1 Tax=Menopon gallinae TaxID=328185 RepID=A0AAW2HML9_9NEOP
MQTRWGIVSAGRISYDFALALKTLPADEHVAIAAASRSLVKATEFCSQHNIPKAYGSYEELANDPNVDVVYIGSINPQHLPLGKLFLNAGKHVLCEKPLCMNKKEVEELIAIAKEKNLFLMEAIWSRFTPLYQKMKEEINNGTIGDIVHIQANFGADLINKKRVTTKELGGSVILDIGVYTIQIATLLLGKPDKIHASGQLNSDGVDENMNVIFSYKNGQSAMLSAHSKITMDNEATVYGTKGTIVLHTPFWCPTSMTIQGKKFGIQLPAIDSGEFKHINSAGLRYEATEVRKCLMNGSKESSVMPWSESLLIAEIEDEIRRQIGVVFTQD